MKKTILLFAGLIFFADTNHAQTATDYDGNVYHIVTIGTQAWTLENLKVKHYNNGDLVPEVQDSDSWINQASGAWCSFDNITNNGAVYGCLYNGYAVTDSRGLAPPGCHIPTDAEWKTLEMYLGMTQATADLTDWRGADEGAKLKETDTIHWKWPTGNAATNSSGFTALGGGWRDHFNPVGYPSFVNLTNTGQWWTSGLYNSELWIRNLCVYHTDVYRTHYPKAHGCSVRCIANCGTPANITASNVTGIKATISWTANVCAVKYRVQYRIQGTTTWTTKMVTAPTVSKLLSPLLSLTTYEFQVRSDYNTSGTSASGYSPVQTFTTLCNCAIPVNINASSLTQTSAVINWSGNSCAYQYRLQYRKQGTTAWITKYIAVPTLTKTITGLTANSVYEFRMRSDCNSTGTINSGYTTVQIFTTALRMEETENKVFTPLYIVPNPCSACELVGDAEPGEIIITDITGRIIPVSFTKSSDGFFIHFPNEVHGIFFIRNNRTAEAVKFIKTD